MASLGRTTRLFVSLAGLAVLATACSTQSDGDASARQQPSAGRTDSASPKDKAERSASPKRSAADPAASRDLLEGARSGDADAIRSAIRRGADLETRDSDRRTPLLLAATGDHVEAAEVLVEAGADPDALDQQHDTPWLVTGVTGSAAMARTLAKADPDYTIVNRYGGTSLIPAGEHGHVDYIREVTTNPDIDVDVNHVNNLGWTALLEAVILGDGGEDHQESVKLLLDGGADRSIADKSGTTALEHAEERGYDEIARLLGK
ncbi:ankyrin repeat domain-containing protein [Streptomyces sp. NPDC002346]